MQQATLLRLPEVRSRTGLGKTTIYKLIKEQSFPKPVPVLGDRLVAWDSEAVQAWIDARIAAAGQ